MNLVRAVEFAKEVGAKVYGVVGMSNGTTAQLADVCVVVDAPPEQRTAQVRAAHGLLVAANEFCDLECGQQPVRQSAAHVRGVGSASRDFGSMRRICGRRLSHRFLRAAGATNASVRRRIQMGTNRAGECSDGDRRRDADYPGGARFVVELPRWTSAPTAAT
jgi:hypothetical protein